MACQVCGETNPPGNRFCGQCGAALPGAGAGAAEVRRPPVVAERRQLTVMFCDLEGSTSLSEQADPEQLRDLVRRYHARAADIIEANGGTIVNFLGDGVLAHFGYPVAHEDDAVRAARAALQLVAAVPELEPVEGMEAPGARVGIDTGLVVVGELGAGARTQPLDVVGETPNIAARLQSLAPSGGVVVSGTTRDLIEGWFDIESLGDHVVRGWSRPLPVYRVRAETGITGRIDAAARRGLAPLVGRARELDVLNGCWERAQSAGQVMLVTGEAGIGKSRLVRALRDRVADSTRVIELTCTPDHESTPLHPLATYLERELTGSDDRRAALLSLAATSGVTRPDVTALFGPLVGLDLDDRDVDVAVETRAARTIALAHEVLTPPGTLLVIEDLHWADATTLALAASFAVTPPSGSMVVFTGRPEFSPAWPPHAQVEHVPVERLGAEDVRALAANMAPAGIDAGALDEIVSRSEGVPLFVEEFARFTEGGEPGRRRAAPVPVTLYDSLMGRLDRVGTAREIAQLGSVIGTEFSIPLLEAVADEMVPVRVHVAALAEAGIVHQRDQQGDIFRFKHALIRDAAYSSLLVADRRRLHASVAAALEEGEAASAVPEVIARHWTEDSDVAKAVQWWRRAAGAAATRGAVVEAIASLDTALGMVDQLPDDERRTQIELRILLSLAMQFNRKSGGGGTRMPEVADRACVLARAIGSDVELLSALVFARIGHQDNGEYAAAYGVAQESVAVAHRTNDPNGLQMAYAMLTTACIEVGLLDDARSAAAKVLEVRGEDDGKFFIATGSDPIYPARAERAWLEWHEGAANRARGTLDEAASIAYDAGNPWMQAFIAVQQSILHWLRREPAIALEGARTSLAFAREYGIGHIETHAMLLEGWARAALGDADGIDEMHEALDQFRAVGTYTAFDRGCAMLGIVYRDAGRIDDAAATVAEGLAVATRISEVREAHDLWVLDCGLRAARGDPDGAHVSLDHALNLARGIGSRMHEARAHAVAIDTFDDADARPALRAVLDAMPEPQATDELRDFALLAGA
jgi:class 3 adenylate cyclase/tetratricopeptide (TPR) repeat protein